MEEARENPQQVNYRRTAQGDKLGLMGCVGEMREGEEDKRRREKTRKREKKREEPAERETESARGSY